MVIITIQIAIISNLETIYLLIFTQFFQAIVEKM